MNDILESITVSDLTPGQILKAAREAKQISIGEIAQRLLLSKNTIVAIEEDDYSRIPASVYAEGYLKAYTQFLQIPTDAVLASFYRLNVYPKSEDTIEIKAQAQNQVCRCRCQELSNLLKGQCRGHIILGAIVVLILSVLVIFIGKQFFGKSTEVVHVPNNKGNDEVISDNQMPIIITTTNAEHAVMPDHEIKAASKKKYSFKKIDKPGEQDVSLMLDASSTTDKKDNEPNLVLTKPQS